MPNLVELFFSRRESLSPLKNIVLDKKLTKPHWFYLNLVDLFSELYRSIEKEKLESLAFASYSYFKVMLAFDHLMDSGERKDTNILVSLMLFEHSIRELAFLFPPTEVFWNEFEKSKSEYYKTVKFEKGQWKELDFIGLNDFEKLAEGKSATLCYSLVDALNSLQKRKHPCTEKLKSFLKSLHIAFQYQDDVDDFKKDIEVGQRTYANYLVNKNVREKVRTETIDIDSDFLYKYFFTSGIASELLHEACKNFQYCLDISEELNLTTLADFVRTEIKRCEHQVKEIGLLMIKTEAKIKKSNLLKHREPIITELHIASSISDSILYLTKNIDNQGLWNDFMTAAGVSEYWVTYYTAYQLADAGIDLPILKDLSQRISKLQTKGSYNETIPEDGDTLNFMIGFMKSNGSLTDQASKNWLNYMKQDGGWVTYSDDAALRTRLNLKDETSLIGWTSPKVCVSAAACKILSGFDDWKIQIKATKKYLLSKQNKDGYWSSYWWTSPIYATSLAIQGLNMDTNNSEPCTRACDWLLKTQLESGAWKNPFTNDESSFYTAYAMKGLLSYEPKKHHDRLEKAANWLIRNQTTDGSWQTTRILAIPATDVEDPSMVTHWRKSSFGVNVVVDDHNRIFTTASVVNALSHFKNYLSK